MNRKKLIRLVSPWTERIETEEAVFSVDISAEEADALLCEWKPTPELFTFPRRKAWYCCEPQCQFKKMELGTWPALKLKLQSNEFLHHGHEDQRFRVPHITHFEPLQMKRGNNRKQRAIAIVSNHGGSPWSRHPDIAYRNKLVTSPLVDLYGRSGWKKYRPTFFHFPAAPKNYLGEIPGDWPGEEKRNLMSEYKVAVCLENMNEPGYFTEKFVEAVVAGCIPVYRATPEIAETFLKGAIWFDPSNPTTLGRKAIDTALEADLAATQDQNDRWLKSNVALASTHAQEVFRRIAGLLLPN